MKKLPKFPNRLPELLERLDLTQADLGRALSKPKQTINKLYSGQTKISADWAKKLAPVMGLSWQIIHDPNDYLDRPTSKEAPSAQEVWRAIGKRLRFVRINRMLRDLPEVAAEEMGWTVEDLTAYESGARPLPIEDLVSFVLRFSVSSEFLLLEKVDHLDEPLRDRWGK